MGRIPASAKSACEARIRRLIPTQRRGNLLSRDGTTGNFLTPPLDHQREVGISVGVLDGQSGIERADARPAGEIICRFGERRQSKSSPPTSLPASARIRPR